MAKNQEYVPITPFSHSTPYEYPGVPKPPKGVPGNTGPSGQPKNPLVYEFKSDDAVENLPKDDVERDILAACGTLARTLIMKRRDYGQHNISKYGAKGIIIRADDKLSRINTLTDAGNTGYHESLEDSWTDLAGYAIIGKLFIMGKW